jgi:hypothetical protein
MTQSRQVTDRMESYDPNRGISENRFLESDNGGIKWRDHRSMMTRVKEEGSGGQESRENQG